MSEITPVILSGGSGTRLWPLSRRATPKQFLEFTPGGTMLAQTLARAPEDEAGFAAPVIVCNADHADLVARHCEGRAATVILEPVARNTAPAIALAALALRPDALMLVMPSDHVIADVDAFRRAVSTAAPLAAADWLVTFGIEPDAPETGYGYIERGDAISDGLFRVSRFVEKPDHATARAYVSTGKYSWNAGIFLFRAGAYRDALAAHAPEMLVAAEAAMAGARREGIFLRPDGAAFAQSPSDSVDYAVMEKATKVAVAPVDMGWSDIGSWDALYDLSQKDGHGNVCSGDVEPVDATGCLVRSDGPLVTLCGVEDLIVIATGDSVMILPRGKSQDTKRIVEALKARQHPAL